MNDYKFLDFILLLKIALVIIKLIICKSSKTFDWNIFFFGNNWKKFPKYNTKYNIFHHFSRLEITHAVRLTSN